MGSIKGSDFAIFHIIFRAGIDQLAPVKTACLKRSYKHLGRRNIGRKRYVVNVAKTQKVHFCLGRNFRWVGASEVENYVYFIVRNLRSYLFRTARTSGGTSLI